MNLNLGKKITEIVNSGIIPLLIGSGVLLTTDEVIFEVMGLLLALSGVYLGNQYLENKPEDTEVNELES